MLAGDPVYGPRAAYWAKRTYDVSTFLTKVINLRQPQGRMDKVVTLPRLLPSEKSMKVSAEPRDILKSIPGVTFREMSAPDACCGSGGSYVLSHYQTSSNIGKKKAEDIDRTKADTVSDWAAHRRA